MYACWEWIWNVMPMNRCYKQSHQGSSILHRNTKWSRSIFVCHSQTQTLSKIITSHWPCVPSAASEMSTNLTFLDRQLLFNKLGKHDLRSTYWITVKWIKSTTTLYASSLDSICPFIRLEAWTTRHENTFLSFRDQNITTSIIPQNMSYHFSDRPVLSRPTLCGLPNYYDNLLSICADQDDIFS